MASSRESNKNEDGDYPNRYQEGTKRGDDSLSTEGAQSNASSILASGPSQHASGSHSTDPNSGLTEKHERSTNETKEGYKGGSNSVASSRFQAVVGSR
jgi:hypothetical protein